MVCSTSSCCLLLTCSHWKGEEPSRGYVTCPKLYTILYIFVIVHREEPLYNFRSFHNSYLYQPYARTNSSFITPPYIVLNSHYTVTVLISIMFAYHKFGCISSNYSLSIWIHFLLVLCHQCILCYFKYYRYCTLG